MGFSLNPDFAGGDFEPMGFKAFRQTLIIRGELTEPPTWFPSFRELTMRLKGTAVTMILIESERELRDLYLSLIHISEPTRPY